MILVKIASTFEVGSETANWIPTWIMMEPTGFESSSNQLDSIDSVDSVDSVNPARLSSTQYTPLTESTQS